MAARGRLRVARASAVERTRTSTSVSSRRPERRASTNSATTAGLATLASGQRGYDRSHAPRFLPPSALIQKTEGIAALLFGLFADAPVGLVLLDTELRYVLVNDTLAELNGVPASAHIGRTVEEVVPELAPQLLPALAGALEGTPVINLELNERPATRPTPRTTLESFYPLRDSDGRVAGIGGVVVDITRRRDAERTRDEAQRHARDSERFLRELLAEERAVLDEVVTRAPAGIALLWGPEARVRLANERFREIALLHDDPTGRPFGEVLPDLWPIAGPLLEEVRTTGSPVVREDFKIPARDPVREGAF